MEPYNRTEIYAIKACKSAMKNKMLINVDYDGSDKAHVELQVNVGSIKRPVIQKVIIDIVKEEKTGKFEWKPSPAGYIEISSVVRPSTYRVKTPGRFCREEMDLDFPEKILAHDIQGAVAEFRRQWAF